MAFRRAFAGFSASGNRSVTFQVLAPFQNIALPAYSNISLEVNQISRLQFCACTDRLSSYPVATIYLVARMRKTGVPFMTKLSRRKFSRLDWNYA